MLTRIPSGSGVRLMSRMVATAIAGADGCSPAGFAAAGSEATGTDGAGGGAATTEGAGATAGGSTAAGGAVFGARSLLRPASCSPARPRNGLDGYPSRRCVSSRIAVRRSAACSKRSNASSATFAPLPELRGDGWTTALAPPLHRNRAISDPQVDQLADKFVDCLFEFFLLLAPTPLVDGNEYRLSNDELIHFPVIGYEPSAALELAIAIE